MITRRKWVATSAAMAACALPGMARAAYPERVIRIVVANAAGGTDDAISRVVAAKLAAEFGQGVIVENRGGGAQTIGGAHVANAAPDGYTLLCLISAGITQTVLREKLSYSLSSFVPVIGVGGFPLAVAGSATASTKITSMQELIAASKSPDAITFASGGVGSMAHLNTTRLLKAVGGKGLHVAYKNNPEGLQALIGGHTQLMFASVSEVAALRGDGKLRALAVTSAQRVPSMPDVPTMRELGYPAIDPLLWHGYMAPADTPPEVVTKLAGAISRAVRDADFQNRFKPLSFEEDLKTGPALSAYLEKETVRWREVIVENNIKVTD